MSKRGIPYRKISATGLVYSGPVLLYGVLLTVGAAASGVYLDDDVVANSERRFHTLTGYNGITIGYMFPGPVDVERGLYATLFGTVTDVTFLLKPVEVE